MNRITSDLKKGSAFASLSDPCAIAAVAPHRLEFAQELLKSQIKLHLLTSLHLTLSHGFLYDNPAIWGLLNDQLCGLLKEQTIDNTSTLVLQVNDVPGAHEPANEESAQQLFRAWLFGDDGGRRLQPSAPRVLGGDEAAAAAELFNMDRRHTTLKRYAQRLKFEVLEHKADSISALLSSTELRLKPADRYQSFGEMVNDYVARSLDAAEKMPWLMEPGFAGKINQLQKLLPPDGIVSRGGLAKANRDLWWYFAPDLNHLRMLSYLPRGSPEVSLTSSATIRVGKLITAETQSRVLSGKVKRSEKWAVALHLLSFEQIAKIRSDAIFQGILLELANLGATADARSAKDYNAYLNEHWAPKLRELILAHAPNCVVDKPYPESLAKDMVHFAAIFSLAYLGMRGINTESHAVKSVQDFVEAAAGFSGAVVLKLLQADTPKKSAHLITSRVCRAAT